MRIRVGHSGLLDLTMNLATLQSKQMSHNTPEQGIARIIWICSTKLRQDLRSHGSTLQRYREVVYHIEEKHGPFLPAAGLPY